MNIALRLLKKHDGYTHGVKLEIISGILNVHPIIVSNGLKENDKRFYENYDPNQTFEALIDRFKDTKEHTLTWAS